MIKLITTFGAAAAVAYVITRARSKSDNTSAAEWQGGWRELDLGERRV